jgi:phosphoribosyl 1,2-cyclic phosphodiesterase
MSLIIPLCSSSGGNSVFVGSKNAGVLIDAGCSFKKLRLLLDSCGTSIDAVKAVLITHEHTDHVKGLYQITKHTDIPVFTSRGTLINLYDNDLIYQNANIYELSELKNIPLDYIIKSFNTSHDSEESVGYTLENDDRKIAYCTDVGIITDEVRHNMLGADFVFLESNYEPDMLKNNHKYPFYIKQRIASDRGHLSNPDCGKFLEELIKHNTTRFILGHLSRENNTPATAYENALKHLSKSGAVLGHDYTLEIAPVINEGSVIAV